VIDLPGLGRSAGDEHLSLDAMTARLVSVIDQPACWLGWSLGGLLAIKIAASYPEKVSGIISVAANPCFVQREGWLSGMDQDVYRQFKSALKISPQKTLSRFVMLQAQGSASSKAVFTQLKAIMTQRSQHIQSLPQLMTTLMLLENDLRDEWSRLCCPGLHIYGEDDALVPAAVAAAVKALKPAHQIVSVKGAGHVPFLTSPDVVIQSIQAFMHTMQQPYG
jgi:pimeloyl-[acyl-carrier protein] methyl ester esterase